MRKNTSKKIVTSNSDIESRYTAMNISIFVFALLVVGVLGLTIYNARQTHSNNIANLKAQELDNMVQTMSRDVFGMKMRYGETPYSPMSQVSLKRLRKNSANLSAILTAFKKGGSFQHSSDGDSVAIKALSDPQEQKLIDEISSKWATIKPIIDNYTSTAENLSFDKTTLDLASSTLINASSTDFPNLTGELAQRIMQRNHASSKMLQMILFAVIAFTIVYFLVFVFFFVRRLKESDRIAQKSRRETRDILRTVNEGLFLINADNTIGEQTSQSITTIFPNTKIAGNTLERLIAPMVNDKDLASAKMYVEQLFQETVVEELISELNPLTCVSAMVRGADGVVSEKFLKFSFLRVYENNKIVRVLASVFDITQSVLLDRELEKQKEQNEENMELLLSVLQVDRDEFQRFFAGAQKTTETINNILKETEKGQQDVHKIEYHGKLDRIFRETHSLKGEASAIGFTSYVSSLEKMEENIRLLKDNRKLSGKDFVNLAVVLESLIQTNDKIKKLDETLSEWQGTNPAEGGSSTKTIGDTLQSLAANVASRNGKDVSFNYYGFDSNALDSQQKELIRDISIQLVRNAIVHGIEKPEERIDNGKNAIGMVKASLCEDSGSMKLTIEDDGRGIDFVAIKNKMVKDPHYNADAIEQISKRELIKYMFKPGVSTMKGSNEDAGRGVGTDVIIDRIKQLKGKMSLKSKEHEFTAFTVTFPRNA